MRRVNRVIFPASARKRLLTMRQSTFPVSLQLHFDVSLLQVVFIGSNARQSFILILFFFHPFILQYLEEISFVQACSTSTVFFFQSPQCVPSSPQCVRLIAFELFV